MPPVHLTCTDRGQHRRRVLATMVEVDADNPDRAHARWHVGRVRSVLYEFPPLAELGEPRTVMPLDDAPPRKRARTWAEVNEARMRERGEESRRLREAAVLVFACPSCRRRPRWSRDRLDQLCDLAAADDVGVIDLSRCE
jgi:hypothetical protein